MYMYKRIMVGLDFTPMDKTLMEHASFLAALLKPEKIYFVNAQVALENRDEWLVDYPELDAPIDEKLKEEIDAELKLHFTPVEGVEIQSLVLDGSATEELQKYVQIKQIDLLVVGRKLGLKGTGIVSQKLARKVPASILFVPEGRQPLLSKIMVSVDFSKNSRMALEEAIELASKSKASSIMLLHTYRLPLGYYKTGKTEAEFDLIAKTIAERKCEELLSEIDHKGIDVQANIVRNKAHDTYEAIYDFAAVQQTSLIVVGGKGRTNASALILGSTVEKLISVDMDIPLLVVKDKKAIFGLLELFKQL
jgi:nucleotide-binding universal stress UspA family protein